MHSLSVPPMSAIYRLLPMFTFSIGYSNAATPSSDGTFVIIVVVLIHSLIMDNIAIKTIDYQFMHKCMLTKSSLDFPFFNL